MPAYDIRNLQLHIKHHLAAIDRVCREHGLRYYIVAGTMLGAVRHGGFIPWDDDIDIGMPRPDYDRLMRHAAEWISHPYEILCAENNDDYPGVFAKMVNTQTTLIEREHFQYLAGTYIDIFPIDGMSDSRLAQKLSVMQYSLLNKIIYMIRRNPYKHGHGPSCWLPLLCRRLFSLNGMMRRMGRLQRRYDYDSSPLVIDHDFAMRGIMPKDIYGEGHDIAFEDITVRGVADAHGYLSRIYGDYMVIPQGEKQRQHNFYYLDYDLPYRDYDDDRAFLKMI